MNVTWIWPSAEGKNATHTEHRNQSKCIPEKVKIDRHGLEPVRVYEGT